MKILQKEALKDNMKSRMCTRVPFLLADRGGWKEEWKVLEQWGYSRKETAWRNGRYVQSVWFHKGDLRRRRRERAVKDSLRCDAQLTWSSLSLAFIAFRRLNCLSLPFCIKVKGVCSPDSDLHKSSFQQCFLPENSFLSKALPCPGEMAQMAGICPRTW